ncbi:unnamed protein product [Paramecium pentaurelia]|uniref:Uncharacterized protein n=1 Tax=Paramecium pentaurelia TaxID=43138 RepID=A0A8S1YH25_9CILI|nr:unnamed protein product [Paramecium pentaurelia]
MLLFFYHYKSKIIGYPSQITQFDDKNGVVSQIYNSDLIISNITRNTILLTKKYVESWIRIIFHVNQTFTILDEINKIYLKYQYRFNFNESQFFISSQDYAFIVQDKQTLYFYSYVKTELKAFKINFEKKINYLVQQGNQLFIYFQNCMIMIVEFQNFQINEVNHSHQVNCTIQLNDDSDKLNIKIQPSQIDILRKNTYTYSLRFHQIIRLQYFINYKKLIIFELNENLLQMKYYQEKNNYYQFLYLIPTYQYIIDQPLIYKTFVQMIAILAHNEQKDQYILIYDLHNKALNSMVSAIQVDEKCQIFNFHSTSQFFYNLIFRFHKNTIQK